MAAYAEGTSVAPERSQAEIAETLRRYGADGYAYGWTGATALIEFTAHQRRVRFTMPLPVDADVARTPAGRTRDAKQRAAALEAEQRRRWRALLLAIKAKLEVVSTGISTFEEEFLAHIVLPDNRTVADHTAAVIEQSYATGKVPPMLQIEAPR